MRAPPWEAAVVFVCLSEKHAAGPELAAHLGVFLVSSLPLQSGCKPHASSDPQDRAEFVPYSKEHPGEGRPDLC